MKGFHAIVLLSFKLFVSFTAVVAKPPVRIPSTLPAARLNKVVSVRGGAGPLNAKDTAKIAAYVFGAQGAYGTLAPAQANQAFGLPSNPLDNYLIKTSSLLVLSVYLLVRELVLKEVSLNKAVGISVIPIVIGDLQSLLNGDISNLGLKANLQYALLVFFSLVAYSTLNGTKYADTLVKATGVLAVAAGLAYYLFPQESLKFFGVQASTAATRVQIRAVAAAQLTIGIIVSNLLWGKNVNALKAVGYGWIPLSLYIIDGLFVNKDFIDLRLNRAVLIFWLVLHTIVAATLAF